MSPTSLGYIYLLASGLSWAAFPVITALGIKSIPPIFAVVVTNALAGVFFAGLISAQKKWHEVVKSEAWLSIFIATVLIGIIYYMGVFIGMYKTSAGNTSMMLLMEIFFTYLILGVWGKEKITLLKALGAVLMIAGGSMIVFQGGHSLSLGDLIIALACIFPPVGNFYAKQARSIVSSETIMFLRSIFTSLVLLPVAFFLGQMETSHFSWHIFLLFLLNGVLVFGLSKLWWIEALHRIPISSAITLEAGAPLLTLLASFLVLGDIPTSVQILGGMPIMLGTLLVVRG